MESGVEGCEKLEKSPAEIDEWNGIKQTETKGGLKKWYHQSTDRNQSLGADRVYLVRGTKIINSRYALSNKLMPKLFELGSRFLRGCGIDRSSLARKVTSYKRCNWTGDLLLPPVPRGTQPRCNFLFIAEETIPPNHAVGWKASFDREGDRQKWSVKK